MICSFKDETQKCFFCKSVCEAEGSEVSSCKYYLRQFPKDKILFDQKFNKALNSALLKRDLFREHINTLKFIPDYSLSVYDNIKKALESVTPYVFEMKIRRAVKKEDLEGNILNNLAKSLYDNKKVVITERFDSDNSILCFINEEKYRVPINKPLDEFFSLLKESPDKKQVFQDSYIIKKLLSPTNNKDNAPIGETLT